MFGPTRSPIDQKLFGQFAPQYDVDASGYFTAVEAGTGSFDLSAINATYSASYAKSAHNALFAGLKSDNLWADLIDISFFMGKTWGGRTIKAKGSGVLTFSNFVTGDWLAAGSGCGLKGNKTNKDVTIVSNVSSILSNNDTGFTVVSTDKGTQDCIGAYQTGFVMMGYVPWSDGTVYSDSYNSTGGRLTTASNSSGIYTLTRTSSTSHAIYRNQTLLASNATSGGSVPALPFNAFSAGLFSDARKTVVILHRGLNATKVTALHARLATFMAAFGHAV